MSVIFQKKDIHVCVWANQRLVNVRHCREYENFIACHMQWRHDRWACTCSQVGSRLIDSMKCSQNPPAFIRRERVPFSCADAAFDYRRFDLRRAKNSLCRLMHSDSAVSSLALSVNINWSASFRLDWPSEIKATHCYPNTISSSEGCTSVDLLLRGKCFDLLHAIAVVCDRFCRWR